MKRNGRQKTSVLLPTLSFLFFFSFLPVLSNSFLLARVLSFFQDSPPPPAMRCALHLLAR